MAEENAEKAGVTAGKLAAVYLKMRDRRAALQREYEIQDNIVKEQMDAVEEAMLEKCKEEDADSIKTPFGTIIRSVKTRIWPADWEAFNTYALEHGAIELYEKRIHQTNMTQWLEEHVEDPPPGLNIDRRYSCSVRKAAKK